MTSNFGYARGTMASQPSLYNEERKLLRIRAWEQRNQETSQDQKLNPESLPLFGKPYKTNKWDELSCRIQKMLGSYEDTDPLASLAPLTSRSDPVQAACTDLSTKPAFHAQCGSADSQKGAFDGSSDSSLCVRNPLYPNRHKFSSPYTKASLHQSHGGGDELSSASHQKSDSCPDDMASLISFTQAHAALSPVAEPLPPRHCSDAGIAEPLDAGQKDPFESRQRRGSLGGSPSSATAEFTYKQSPAWEGGPLPSQSFPPPLAPKAPNIAMPQKPTAYVRPMDGQDQVANESPELKPSPQPYAPLPGLIGSKSTPEKVKMLTPFLETRSNEAQCVEDILREMTHSWPPPLTAIHTPSTAEPPKSPLHPKEVTHIPSSHPDQKNYSSPVTAPSSVSQQDVPLLEAAHSSGVESASSSDSESSSESENESCTEDVLQLPRGGATESKNDVPVVSHGDWQLGNWIRSSQQSSSAEGPGDGSASQSTPLKKLVPSSKTPAGPRAPTPRLSPLKEESRGQQRGGRSLSSSRKTTMSSGSKHASKSVKRPGPAYPQAGVRAVPAVVGAQDTEPSFTCRPKVKRKPERGSGSKTDVKKPAKGSSGEKLKSKSRVVPAAPCPTCAQKPSSQCSCLAQNPAPLDRLAPPPAPPPPVKLSSKVKTETLSEKSLSKPYKGLCPADQQQVTSAKIPGAPPRSLLVKISLDLLVHVPRGSGAHQQGSSKRKRGPKVEEGCTPSAVKSTKKRPAELDGKGQPKKKHRVQNEPKVSHRPSPVLTTVKPESSGMEEKKQKKSKTQPPTPQGTKKRHKHSETRVNGKSSTPVSGATVKHKKTTEKSTERSKAAKVSTKSSSAPPVPAKPTREALTSRQLLVFEDRKHPVKHYIKEAKKLKHKADAETDKVRKAFDYLNAAISFVESGITMETDPHSPKSSYAMYGDTVELIKFVLKLKSAADSPLSPSENDFVVLCMRCQSLLQMAIFNYKHKTAVKYSKTLTEHFKNSKPPQEPSFCNTDSLSPMCDMPSPASSSCPSSNNSGAGGSGGPLCSTVAIPKLIHQVALSYVNITAMFLSAHDIWEQAEELAHSGSGMLSELDLAMGPLSLMSSMNSVVRYTRQGLHWLRLAG